MWNMFLVIVTFLLTIFGTFLTRSNILQSVHAFPETGMGPYFIAFMVICAVVPLWLVYSRREQLVSYDESESIVSKEGSFLLNNLLLVGSSAVILLGTMFPLLSTVFGGRQVELGKSFFNRVNAPIFLLIILLAGICTTIGWRRASVRNLSRNLLAPAAAAVLVTVMAFVLGARAWGAVIAVFVGAFLLGTVLYEWARGVRGRVRASKENVVGAFFHLVWANRPRYGGYIVHVGVAVMAIGIVWSSLFVLSKEATLAPGDSITVGEYTLRFAGLERYQTARRDGVTASLEVSKNGAPAGRLTAMKFYDPRQEVQSEAERQWVTEVGIRSTPSEDLYVILISWDASESTAVEILVNPLVMWIWIGGGILVLGGLIAFWPERSRPRADEAGGSESR